MNFVWGIHHKVCFWAFWGSDYSNSLNSMDQLGTFQSLHPSASPFKGILHFLQIGIDSSEKNCLVRRFNYGKQKNLLKYNTATPPSFNISSIAVPVRAYFGSEDKYYSMSDIQDFVKMMRNLPQFSYRVMDSWGHMSFAFGIDSMEFYEDVNKDLNTAILSARD